MERSSSERGALPSLDRMLSGGDAVLMSPLQGGHQEGDPVAMTGSPSRLLSDTRCSTLEMCEEDLYSGIRGSLVPDFSVLAACSLGLQQLQLAALRALRHNRRVGTRESSCARTEPFKGPAEGDGPPEKRRRIHGKGNGSEEASANGTLPDAAVSLLSCDIIARSSSGEALPWFSSCANLAVKIKKRLSPVQPATATTLLPYDAGQHHSESGRRPVCSSELGPCPITSPVKHCGVAGRGGALCWCRSQSSDLLCGSRPGGYYR